MPQGSAERRRGRRLNLEASLLVRHDDVKEAGPFQTHTTKNLSLAGVYFETEREPPFAVNEMVIASVSVPESYRQGFPFTRVAGKSRVVRVDELGSEGAAGKRYGVALEFGNDVTALTAIPARG